MKFKRIVVSILTICALAVSTVDVEAGPFKRLRQRRGNGSKQAFPKNTPPANVETVCENGVCRLVKAGVTVSDEFPDYSPPALSAAGVPLAAPLAVQAIVAAPPAPLTLEQAVAALEAAAETVERVRATQRHERELLAIELAAKIDSLRIDQEKQVRDSAREFNRQLDALQLQLDETGPQPTRRAQVSVLVIPDGNEPE